jgi:hypothetical protein
MSPFLAPVIPLEPTARQSEAETHVTALRTLPSVAVPTFGESTMVHELPSHFWINVLAALPWLLNPTAQQLESDVQATP